jgi:hypothetical protein
VLDVKLLRFPAVNLAVALGDHACDVYARIHQTIRQAARRDGRAASGFEIGDHNDVHDQVPATRRERHHVVRRICQDAGRSILRMAFTHILIPRITALIRSRVPCSRGHR